MKLRIPAAISALLLAV